MDPDQQDRHLKHKTQSMTRSQEEHKKKEYPRRHEERESNGRSEKGQEAWTIDSYDESHFKPDYNEDLPARTSNIELPDQKNIIIEITAELAKVSNRATLSGVSAFQSFQQNFTNGYRNTVDLMMKIDTMTQRTHGSMVVVVVVSQFNGTSTPKGSYSAKTNHNDCNVNSSRYSLSTALCESNSL